MGAVCWYLGAFSAGTWRWLSRGLVLQFLGMLMFAWLIRSPDIYRSTPFQNYISTLGVGRMSGNAGGWVFCACFCTFAALLVPWHAHIIREVWRVNRVVATFLIPLATMGIVGAAFVGIFDEAAMGPVSKPLSKLLHGIGSSCAFSGHVLGAFLGWPLFALVYKRASAERRVEMPHPCKLLVPVATLVLVVVWMAVVREGFKFTADSGWSPTAQFLLRGPFWQWSLMLALMFWLFGMSLWWPDPLVRAADDQDSPSTDGVLSSAL